MTAVTQQWNTGNLNKRGLRQDLRPLAIWFSQIVVLNLKENMKRIKYIALTHEFMLGLLAMIIIATTIFDM